MTQSSEALASRIINDFYSSKVFRQDDVDEIVKRALDELGLPGDATRSLFIDVIEKLCDSFSPEAVTLYNRLLCRIVQNCRSQLPEFDNQLKSFGLKDENELFTRVERMRPSGTLKERRLPSRDVIRRIIILSRVTIGADVAVSSVILARLQEEFPHAEFTIIGSAKLQELFGGNSRIRFIEAGYSRSGGLLDRLECWTGLLSAIQSSIEGAQPSQCLIIDPDSRLTQLGILPVTHSQRTGPPVEDSYLFFPSREYMHSIENSLGEITSFWMDEITGIHSPTLPRLELNSTDVSITAGFIQKLRNSGHTTLATINLGVGGNEKKRIGGDFEIDLVSGLLKMGTTVLLDRGAGIDESTRINNILEKVWPLPATDSGDGILELDENGLRNAVQQDRIYARLIVWSGRLGLLAGFIKESFLYTGYDSAGQHIAAALGVPLIDFFSGFNSPRMVDRWRPTGPSVINIIVADGSLTPEALSQKALELAGRLLQSVGKKEKP
jgi:hypothetical protein